MINHNSDSKIVCVDSFKIPSENFKVLPITLPEISTLQYNQNQENLNLRKLTPKFWFMLTVILYCQALFFIVHKASTSSPGHSLPVRNNFVLITDKKSCTLSGLIGKIRSASI